MAKTKARRGRPTVSRSEAKATPVQIRMSDGEKAAFKMAAELSGLSLSAWMRERLRHAAIEELRKMGKSVPFL